MIAEIIPLLRLPKNLSLFDYNIPSTLEGTIKIGQLVNIPFRNRMIDGLVFKIRKDDEGKNARENKEINKIWELIPEINKERLELLQEISLYYITPLPLLAKTFFPSPPRKNFKIKNRQIIPIVPRVSEKNVKNIKSIFENFAKSSQKNFLLHYSSKKNKVAIYSKIILENNKKNKQTLILMPQISDINRLLPYLYYFFKEKIAILHGELSKTEYWQEWQKIKNGEKTVILGTRSAIFAPCSNLGLIIIDGEESDDFKQYDQNPRYDARQIAEKLMHAVAGQILFTSQSPRVETFYETKGNSIKLLEESEEGEKNNYFLVDMNREIEKKNFSPVGDKIRELIKENLNRGKKSILLLNSRGSSSLVSCRDCGFVFKCRNCRKPLVLHEDDNFNKLVCRECNLEEEMRTHCSKCNSISFKYLGAGTKKVEKEVEKIFPKTRILRIDSDAGATKLNTDADIYIGTEYFVKNYLSDINNINLVAIISTDNLFFLPDFHSGEKTFSWIRKIINLSEEKRAIFLIQTFYPENNILKLALKNDYENFFKQEIENRKMLNYPPFGKFIKLTFASKGEKETSLTAFRLKKELAEKFGDKVEILNGENTEKSKQKFISKIILKTTTDFPKELLFYLNNLLRGWTIDIDPKNLL